MDGPGSCGRCGADVAADDRSCAACGNSLAADGAAPAEGTAERARSRRVLAWAAGAAAVAVGAAAVLWVAWLGVAPGEEPAAVATRAPETAPAPPPAQAPAALTAVPPGAVAVVGSAAITGAELEALVDRTRASYASQGRPFPADGSPELAEVAERALAVLVERARFEQEARALGVEVTEKQVDERIAELVETSYDGDAAYYEDALVEQGLTEQEARLDVEAELLDAAVLETVVRDVAVTEDEIRAFVEESRDDADVPGREGERLERRFAERLVAEKRTAAAESLAADLEERYPARYASGYEPAATSRCPDFVVIDSRGSGEQTSLSVPGGIFYAAFRAAVRRLDPSARVAVIPNGYPAWGSLWTLISALLKLPQRYHESVVEGKAMLAALIDGRRVGCPDMRLVLTGFSQGAHVTGDVYQEVSPANVVGVVLFGDPKFNGADPAARGGEPGLDGALGTRPPFRAAPGRAVVLSYCHAGDPVCQGVSQLRQGSLFHKDYGAYGEPEAAAEQLARLVAGSGEGTIRIVRTERQVAALAGISLGPGTKASAFFDRFGAPSSCRLNGGPYDVVASWSEHGVTIWTTTLGLAEGDFEDGCTTPWGTFVSRVELRGKRWGTEEGLRPGDTVATLRQLYPDARSEPLYAEVLSVAEVYSIVDEPCRYGDSATACPIVLAVVQDGRVAFLDVEVGGQGD